jgi:hypothetical protein
MRLLKRIPTTFFFTLMVAMLPVKAAADLIVLKDGTHIEAQNVWEDNGLVRFSLPNYDGIIITYAKEIIERIERGQQGVENQTKAADEKEREGTERITENALTKKNNPTVTPSAGQGDPADSGGGSLLEKNQSIATTPDLEIDMSLVESVAGIQFYSARRAIKYQTGPDARFHTFKDAIDDLATKFNKDPYWIGQNLGNTNDLGQIYINLSRPEEQTEAETEETVGTAGILFYDPRRLYKYWVDADSKFRTLDEAINSLALQYVRSPEWVIDHLGETNDLSEIHHNLEAAISSETGQ